MFFYNRATMLIIALPQKAQPSSSAPYHYWLSPNGSSISLSGQAAASLMPKNAGEVVVVMPWQWVSWHSVKLPPLSQFSTEKVTALLNGILEDQLLDELSTLHFILPSNLRELTQAGQEVVIGVCSRDLLRQATQALQAQGITVQRIVCELSPSAARRAPSNAQQSAEVGANSGADKSSLEHSSAVPVLHVIGPASSPPSAVLCTAEGVIKLPPSTADWSAFKALGAQDLIILSEPQWVQSTTQALGREPRLHSLSQRILEATQSNWDAATGEWEQSRGLRFYRRIQRIYLSFMHTPQWSLARKAIVALIVLNLSGLNAWSWIQSANIKERETELTKLLKETFPAIGLIVDPSLQMQREMRRLQHARGQSAAGDVESMLAAVALQLPQNYKLQSFSYTANELRLNGVAKELISPVSQSTLQKSGYTIRGENTVLGGQTVPVLVVTYVDAASSK